MVSPSKAKLSRIAGQQQQQQQQQQEQEQQSQASQRKASGSKVQLVKGPKPLVHHRFYLDIEQHQIATKIETTIKQLGGSVEFLLNKDVTHFVTDKLQPTSAAVGETGEPKELPYCASPSGATIRSTEHLTRLHHRQLQQQQQQQQQSQQPQRSSRQLLHLTHQQQIHGQYVNDYGPATSRTSSPCPPPITSTVAPSSSSAGACITASGAASVQQKPVVSGTGPSYSSTPVASPAGFDGKVKPIHLSSNASLPTAAVPRSRTDVMLQRVRQQQQQHPPHQAQPSYSLLHSSPLNPAAYPATPTNASIPSPFQSSSHHKQAPSPSCYSPAGTISRTSAVANSAATTRQNSPVDLARSWGTLIWSAEYALKFLRKVLASLPKEKGARTDTKADTGGRTHRHHHHHGGSSSRPAQHVHHLRGRFIKIESRSAPGSYRPVYQEFKNWPRLLFGKKAPFADVNEPPDRKEALDEKKEAANRRKGVTNEPVEGPNTSRMTRKLGSAASTTTTTTATGKSGETVVKKRALEKPAAAAAAPPPRDCGYCEICRIEYDSLAVHLQSESHQSFVQNDDNFLSLDRLLDSFGGRGGASDTRLAAEAEGYDGGGDDGAGTVAVETFFQQLSNATRIKRAGEELLYERRLPNASHQLKAIAGDRRKKEEKREEKDGEEERIKTVTVAVTATTTAAADDELIERKNTAPIGAESKREEALVEAKQATPHTAVKETEKEEKKGGEKRLSRGKVKGKRRVTAPPVDECGPLQQEKEGFDGDSSDGDEDDAKEKEECGNTTKELIKRALQTVIASFDCSDSDFLADVEKTLEDSSVVLVDGEEASVVEEKEKNKSVKGREDKSSPVGKSASDKRAANSSRVSVTNRDNSCKQEEEGQRTSSRVRAYRQATEAAAAAAQARLGRRGERRSDRISGTAFQEATEQDTSAEGMFGRRSAIHHHPHNQLNHHNHQKHKSTLSALLLKQKEERAQQQLSAGGDGQQWEGRKAIDNTTTTVLHVDHAAGMKVITDFRTKQQAAADDDELVVADKSVLLGVPTAEAAPVPPPIESVKQDDELVTAKAGGRRKRISRTEQQEETASMGLKASAMNKHHHHHHHHHHLNDGGVSGGTGGGTKTRHATELAAALLECEGLDPKNTKRISLGLRQNPKRANLNEDFTSLLDETLERSKSSSTASASARRASQSRVRALPKGGKEQTVTTKQKQEEVEDENPNRGCEEEGEKQNVQEVLEHDRLKPAVAAAVSSKRSSASTKKAVTLEDIKVRGIRWRAPSPTTRPPVKSPLLYKVIDSQAGEETISSSAAARSSTNATALQQSSRKDHPSSAAAGNGGGNSNAQSANQARKAAKLNGGSAGSPGKKNGLIVKIRRVRQSELSLLNDEAENFMFPRKDDSSSEEETDDDRQTSSEGFQAGLGPNNYSIDITSSSEADRGVTVPRAMTFKRELNEEKHSEEEEEEAEQEEVREEDKQPKADGGSRKRKKSIPASTQRASSLESSDHTSSPFSFRPSPTPPTEAGGGPVAKRARLEMSSRRKGQQQQTADFGKGQDPVDARVRFPGAPIQPCPVAAKTSPSSTERARRGRSQSNVSEEEEDDHDEDDDAEQEVVEQEEEKGAEEEEEEEDERVEEEMPVEVAKVVVKQNRGKGTRGRRGHRKRDRETVTKIIPAGPCPSCSAGTSSRGRRGGRRGGGSVGRRGRRGGAGRGGRAAASRQQSACTCHLLDATRMPPPSSRRRNDDTIISSVERATTPISPRKKGTRASKTKTTPPSAAAAAAASSSLFASPSLDGSAIIAGSSSLCGSYIKSKEDGMGAVFKWINFRKRCEEIEPYRFAFERVPSLEPWYETFQRQDDGTEKVYEYFGSTGYRKLPYEMGPLPALGQNCCILNYKLVANRKSNRTTSLQSSSSASMEPSSPGGRKSSRPDSSDVQNVDGAGGDASAATVDESELKKSSPSSSLSSLPLKKRKLLLQESSNAAGSASKTEESNATTSGGGGGGGEGSSNSSRIARLIAGANERPRKSPREHASTLAILSLLQQQQHRKRAGTIKILTSPKKATTATATQTNATSFSLHEQLLHQDADSNGEEQQSRSCSRASDRASSRAGSSNGIKFDRPLFPDSSYVNSRTLCQELDAFLSDELNRVVGKDTSTLDGIVKKERSEIEDELATEATQDKAGPQELLPSLDENVPDELDLEMILPPSVVQEGIAIERNELPVSKRDLLDVLQTVGTEPPLSLKLVQRCESVVKKIVQYDRKERPMVASGTGSGLAISSSSPVIGLQLFDSGSALVSCGSAGGPGSVGGTFLKKRINRTGWPTNKRKLGTRTRQQSRFGLPSSLTGAKKSLSRESIKKEPEVREDVEGKGEVMVSHPGGIVKQEQTAKDALTEEEEDEEEEEEDDNEEDEEDDNVEDHEEEEEDDGETVIEEKVRPAAKGAPRKDVAQANHKKTDSVRGKQRNDSKEESLVNHTPPEFVERKRRKRSVSKRQEPASDEEDGDAIRKDEDVVSPPPVASDAKMTVAMVDSMPTLRAALMRDNSQLQRLLSSPSVKPSVFSSSSTIPGSFNRGTVPFTPTSRGSATPSVSCESVPCPTSSSSSTGGSSGPVLGVNCCKYVTKTTTTMTRVDYDGGGSGSTVGGGGLTPLKRKHSRDDVTTHNEEESQYHPKEENRQKQQVGVTNRHRGSNTGPAIGALATTHDSDDKECDSISSRSIFVSDDCDTTSSSTAINPPDDRPPSSTSELPSVQHHQNDPSAPSSTTASSALSQANQRLPPSSVRVRRKESTDNEETIQAETVNQQSVDSFPLANKSTKSPRTPSERIRNSKLVKNRRTATGRMEQAKKPEKQQHHDVQQIRSAASSKRRKSCLGPPLPPPSMMPLSPPLTTSTSSSSSSSYGADDKPPLSPVVARGKGHDGGESVEEAELVREENEHPGAKSGELILTPSKIKTRSSTFGYSPPKRTYGTGKHAPKKLPFVSLVKANFVQVGESAVAVTIPNGKKDVGSTNRSGSGTENTIRRRKSVSEKKSRRQKSSSPSVVRKGSAAVASAAAGRNEKNKEPAVAEPVPDAVGKRSKKLTHKAKQLLAGRKRLPKVAKDAASGHFNNNSDAAHSNDEVEKEEEDPLQCPINEEQQKNHLPEHYNRQQREPNRVKDLMEEHLIDEEDDDHHELMEVEEGEETEVEEMGEEEHYELLEVEELEEDDDDEKEMMGGDVADQDGEDKPHHRAEEVEDTYLAGENVQRHHHHHRRQRERRDEEERKLIMADHDYSDQHDGADPPIVDAEFVEVVELEEHHLEGGEEEEREQDQEEEEHEEEEDEEEDDEDDDDESTITTVTAPPAVSFAKHHPRVKLTFTTSAGGTVLMTSAGVGPAAASTSSNTATTTTTKTFKSVSPTKYSPRKLRKPRGRWYRER